MARMRAVQVTKAGDPFTLVEREIPDPGAGQVRIKVEACGVCHSDAFVQFAARFPASAAARARPRGRGPHRRGRRGRVGWKEGERVGVGWHGGHCFQCDAVPQGHVHQLRERRKHHRRHARRRLRRVHGRAGRVGGAHPRAARRGRRRAAALRRHHHLQRAPQQRRPARRHRRGAGHRRAGSPGAPVRGAHGLPHGRALARRRQGGAGARARRARLRRHGDRIAAAEGCRSSAAPTCVLATAPHADAIASAIDGLKPRGKLLIVAAPFEPLERLGLRRCSAARRSPAGRAAARSTPRTRWRSARSPACGRASRPSGWRRPRRRSQKVMENKVRFRAVLVP